MSRMYRCLICSSKDNAFKIYLWIQIKMKSAKYSTHWPISQQILITLAKKVCLTEYSTRLNTSKNNCRRTEQRISGSSIKRVELDSVKTYAEDFRLRFMANTPHIGKTIQECSWPIRRISAKPFNSVASVTCRSNTCAGAAHDLIVRFGYVCVFLNTSNVYPLIPTSKFLNKIL